MIRFDAAGERIGRTTNVVAANSDYSCLFWAKPLTTPGIAEYQNLFLQVNGLGTYTRWVNIFHGQLGFVGLSIQNGSGEVLSTSVAIPQDKPTAIGYIRSGNNHSIYIDGALLDTIVVDITALTLNEQYMGDDGAQTVYGVDIQGFKEWNTAITLAELIADSNSAPNIKTANLVASTPLLSNVNDNSGNGNNWTSAGSPTFVDSSNQVPLTNITNGTNSVDITLGQTYIQIVRDSGGTTRPVAYKYTGAPGEQVFGAFAIGTVAYITRFSAFSDDLWATPYNSISNYPARPVEVPILTLEMTIYLRIGFSGGGNPAGSLYLKTHSFTQQAVPAGSILINDAGNGPAVALLEQATGDPLQLRNDFVPGELAHVLHDSLRMIHQDINTFEFVIHNTQLVELTRITGSGLSRLGGNRDDRFTVIRDLGATVDYESYDPDGVLLDTQNVPLSSLSGASVNSTYDIVYMFQGSANAPIKRWDSVNQVFLSDLVAGRANMIPVALLWLNGNTILVAYNHATVPASSDVKHYSAAGATLATFNTQFGARTGADFHIAYDFPAVNPDVNFWAWIKIANGLSRFMQIRLSDGTILQQYDRVHFTNGSADADTENFGHSESCNFLLIPEALSESTATLIVLKLTIPVDEDAEFNVSVQGGLSPDTITLQHGESEIYNNVPPGTYAVFEEPTEGWVTTYEVSNGDPNDAIEIEEGDTVTVTITNKRLGSIRLEKSTNIVSGQLFDFLTSGLTPINLQLSGGQSFTFEDLDPDQTYAIEEINLPTGWTQISVVVSNGSPISAIIVEPGMETTVVFTNNFGANQLSGIYKIEPGKTDDTLWIDLTPPGETFRRKIPDPTARTSMLGD